MRSLRRPIIVIVLASFAVSIPAVTAPAVEMRTGRTSPLGTVDWPQVRFSPVHHGSNPFETVLSPSTVGGLHRVWVDQFGALMGSAAPSVVDGVLYVGAFDGLLRAIDVATGSILWSVQLDSLLENAPAVVDGMIFVHSSEGGVYALDQATGSVLWNVDTGPNGVSPVTVVDGVVFVNGFYELFALDEADGHQLWSVPFKASSASAPTVAGGRVFVADSRGFVRAYDTATGARLWARHTALQEAFQLSTPAASNGTIYVGSFTYHHAVYALDAATGGPVWKVQLGGYMDSSPAVVNGTVYIGSYTEDAVYALDARNGRALWSVSGIGVIGAGVSVSNGVLYVPSDRLYAMDAASGTILWSGQLDGRFSYSTPVVVNGMVFLAADGGSDSALYAFGL